MSQVELESGDLRIGSCLEIFLSSCNLDVHEAIKDILGSGIISDDGQCTPVTRASPDYQQSSVIRVRLEPSRFRIPRGVDPVKYINSSILETTLYPVGFRPVQALVHTGKTLYIAHLMYPNMRENYERRARLSYDSPPSNTRELEVKPQERSRLSSFLRLFF